MLNSSSLSALADCAANGDEPFQRIVPTASSGLNFNEIEREAQIVGTLSCATFGRYYGLQQIYQALRTIRQRLARFKEKYFPERRISGTLSQAYSEFEFIYANDSDLTVSMYKNSNDEVTSQPGLSDHPIQNPNEIDIQLTYNSVECDLPSSGCPESQYSVPIFDDFDIDVDQSPGSRLVEIQSLGLAELLKLQEALSLTEQENRRWDDSDEQKYQEAFLENQRLKKQLKKAQDLHDAMNTSWVCEFCSTSNDAWIRTTRDDCEACESPSPLKIIRLTGK